MADIHSAFLAPDLGWEKIILSCVVDRLLLQYIIVFVFRLLATVFNCGTMDK